MDDYIWAYSSETDSIFQIKNEYAAEMAAKQSQYIFFYAELVPAAV